MSSYSLGGYRIAVRARSRPTLVVEGRSDYLVMTRLFLEMSCGDASFRAPLIDTPDLIKDDSLAGMGNKSKVRAILDAIGDLQPKVAGLVDREWDGFCLTSFAANDEPDPDPPLYVTKGHSIENYFFEPAICTDFILRRYAEIVSAELIREIHEGFRSLLDFAFSYSVSLGRRHLITRAGSLLSPHLLARSSGEFTVAPEFQGLLEGRGVAAEVAAQVVLEIAQVQQQLREAGPEEQVSRWKSHGHLGDEAIWACIGKMALDRGVALESAKTIASGFQEERLRSAADNLAIRRANGAPPVAEIVEWVSSQRRP